MGKPRNIVGPQVRKLRLKQRLTQPALAAKCNLAGWDISRETLAKVEAQIRWVSDVELLMLAKALKVKLSDLFPDS